MLKNDTNSWQIRGIGFGFLTHSLSLYFNYLVLHFECIFHLGIFKISMHFEAHKTYCSK